MPVPTDRVKNDKIFVSETIYGLKNQKLDLSKKTLLKFYL
ncbi:hypothetical protein SAMN05421761_101362 [Belliella pelovolcani]|uniref:Uncharacterized protein n=1 Tax=Belliella pelovolcani TaxID=529505 RepID=A0A1N7K0H2_9BACT|nr:hypothetical protein SAMN05421761_101362 [Belliella pelovolcani]